MWLKWFLAVVLILSSCGILFCALLMAASALPAQDFSNFWAAAQLISKNPYSHQLVAELEKSHGMSVTAPWLVIKNPPWAILFVLPFSFFPYPVALALWNTFTIIALVVCSRVIWNMFTHEQSLAPLLLPLLFGPTVVLVILGQWTILVLVGVTVFLSMIEQKRDWLAGAALMLVLGKFHIALLFLLAVAFWTFYGKRWAVLFSGVITTGVASLITLALNPHIFAQFLEHDLQATHQTSPIPNLGGILYEAFRVPLLALLPQIIGLLWVIFYWFSKRDEWDWKSHGMLVLVSSIACSYYSYPYDQLIALPALVAAFLTGNRRLFVLLFVAANIGYMLYIFQVAGRFGFNYMFLSWTPAAWLITYVASQPSNQRQQVLARS